HTLHSFPTRRSSDLTLEKLRREIEPVTPSEFLQFLACWQHVDPQYQLDGPRGVAEVLNQLAGFEVPAWAWEKEILPRRVKDYRRDRKSTRLNSSHVA